MKEAFNPYAPPKAKLMDIDQSYSRVKYAFITGGSSLGYAFANATFSYAAASINSPDAYPFIGLSIFSGFMAADTVKTIFTPTSP